MTNSVVSSDRPVFVFSTPATSNGDLHVGHLSGPYLGADVYTRYQRQNGVEAYHLSGSDDYQSYIIGRARALGVTPAEIAARYGPEIKSTLERLDTRVDQFTITQSAPHYAEGLRDFFRRLTRSGLVAKRDAPALFDAETGDYLYEVDLRGQCPHCGLECSGNNCEDCGVPNHCVDLVNPVSHYSDAPPVTGTVRRWSLDMESLKDAILSHQNGTRVPARIRLLTQTVLSQPDLNLPITHPSDWGIRPDGQAGDAAGDETGDQTIWVWPEMAYGFLYGIEQLGRDRDNPWRKDVPDDDWKIVHFFGYDNAVHHTILYPALYKAAFPNWTPDIDYHTNEFFLLDGEKFSTSRQHAIWGKEILNDDSVDALRLYLSMVRPEVTRTNFNLDEFRQFQQDTLTGQWNRWLSDLGGIVQTDFDGHVPETGDLSGEYAAFWATLESRRTGLNDALGPHGFSLRRAARQLLGLVDDITRFADLQKPLRGLAGQKATWRTSIALQLAAALLLSRLTSAMMPRFSASLSRALGAPETPDWPEAPEFLRPGATISLSCEPFFQTPADAAPTSKTSVSDR